VQPAVKKVLLAAAVLGVVFIAWKVWNPDDITLWLERVDPIAFFALMAVLPAVGIPMTPFLIIAGASFGGPIGVTGSLIAIALNLALCFVLARLLKPMLASLLRWLGHALPNLSARGKSPARVALTVKLVPGVPAFLKSYVLAVTGIGFGPYFAVSMLISGAYAVLVVVLGKSLLDHERNNVLVIVLLLGMVGLAVWRWRRGQRAA
jgi:uncharacterized membrane protein YdjX (TVP38/TMEM64 family)